MKRTCIAFLLMMALMVSCLGGFTVEASVASFSVKPVVSESPNEQWFVLTNNGETATFTWDGGSAALEAGATKTIKIATSQRVTIAVKCEADGSYQYAGSMNQYTLPVIKRYGDAKTVTSTELISLAGGQKVISVDALATVENVMYECANNSVIVSYGDTKVEFNYKPVEQKSRNVKVYYIDENGYSIGNDSFTIQPNSSETFKVPNTLSVSGKKYNLAEGQPKSISQDYINTTSSYTIVYKAEKQAAERPYTVKVVYVDAASDATIANNSFTVPVGETVKYNTAKNVVTASYDEYELAEGQPTVITHTSGDATRSYTVYYNKTGTRSPYAIKIKFVDSVTGKVLDTVSKDVAVNGSVEYQLPAKMTVSGVEYVLTAGQGTSIKHSYGQSQTTYYVDYDALSKDDLDAYTVVLKYVDVANNKELKSQTKTVERGSSVKFKVPDTFEKEDVEYVILSGQESEITHDFTSRVRSYAVYYRDSNDTTYEDIEDVTPPVENENNDQTSEGTQTRPNEAPEVEPEEAETEEVEAEEVNTEAEEPETEEAEVETEEAEAESEEAATSEEEAASSEEVEIIEEEEVPLASEPGEGVAEKETAKEISLVAYVAGGTGLAAILALVIFFIVKKRKTV